MKNTTIVTAYFDIERGQSNIAGMKRGNAKYIEYFKFWARLKNDLIVYTTKEFKDEIEKIRCEYVSGGKQTKIVIIDDVYSLEADIWGKMELIENKNEWAKMRLHTKAMSNGAKYNYIMLMKYWCVNDAIKRFHLEGNVAWVDFGFNHGNACYSKSEEFSFKWNPKCPDKKVCLYTLSNPMKINLIKMLLLQSDCIMGALVIMDAVCGEEFYNLCVKAMEALLMLETMDDDQQLLAMAYKWKPELFEIHESTWFMPLKENGGQHLSIVNKSEPKNNKSIKKVIRSILGDMKYFVKNDYSRPIVKDYCKRLKKIFNESM